MSNEIERVFNELSKKELKTVRSEIIEIIGNYFLNICLDVSRNANITLYDSYTNFYFTQINNTSFKTIYKDIMELISKYWYDCEYKDLRDPKDYYLVEDIVFYGMVNCAEKVRSG